MMIPRIEVLEMNWQEHIAEGTTLHDAIKLCIGAVRSRKWRDNKHHLEGDPMDTGVRH